MATKADRELKRAADALLAAYEVPPVDLVEVALGGPDPALWIVLGNVDWLDNTTAAMEVLIVDATNGAVLRRMDPVGALLETWGTQGDDGAARLERAVQALQGGINRINEYRHGTP